MPRLVDDTETVDAGFVFCKICQRSYTDGLEIEHSEQFSSELILIFGRTGV